MHKPFLLLLLAFLLQFSLHAQRKTLPIGSELTVKEITSWDPNYNKKDLIVGKKAIVSTRPLLFSFDDHWSGYITVDGIEYRLLDMRITILSGETPEKKIDPKDVLKLKTQLKELVTFSADDFSSIKSNFPKSIPYKYGPSFLANYQINGTKDSSTIIYFDEYVKRWNLQTIFNTDQYSAQGIDYILRTLDWPCGKLEPLSDKDKLDTSANISTVYYVPVNRKQTGNKYRYFTICLSATFYNGKTVFLSLDMLNRSYEIPLLGEQTASPAPAIKKDLKKMEKDILVLAEAYKTAFKSIKTDKLLTGQYWEKSYEANCELEGSDPGSGIVFFDTTQKCWSVNIPINTDKYTSDEVENVLLNMTFPFGKLEREILSWNTDSRYFKPKDQDKLPVAYKNIEFIVLPFKLDGKEISLSLMISRSTF